MEEYKKIVNRRIWLYSGVALVSAILGIKEAFVIIISEKGSITNSFVSSFQLGIIFGLGILALFQIIKLGMVIKDEKKLKILYNQEHDERLKTIRSKAGMPMLMITSALMLIAAIIAGYFNIVIFYTLVITAITQLALGTIVKLYYTKVM